MKKKLDLLKAAFHGFILQQSNRPHQITDQNKVAFAFEIQGNNVIKVTALNPKLFLSFPFIQQNLKK